MIHIYIMGTLGAFLVLSILQWVLYERGLRAFERQAGIRDER